jgi:hypothetical protein
MTITTHSLSACVFRVSNGVHQSSSLIERSFAPTRKTVEVILTSERADSLVARVDGPPNRTSKSYCRVAIISNALFRLHLLRRQLAERTHYI